MGFDLKQLFEYQKFENNGRLAGLIAETEARYGSELSEDSLDFVNAAGAPIMKIEDQPIQ